MLDTLSLYSDELMELMLEGKPTPRSCFTPIIREQTIAREITPVLMGSAFKNKGVQPLLDAVGRYLPSPLDRMAYATDNENEGAEIALAADPDAPDGGDGVQDRRGIVRAAYVYPRVSGADRTRKHVYEHPDGRKQRVSRILRMHANDREDIDVAEAGDIVALIGVDCNSGDTLCSLEQNYSLESMHVAEPVISLAITTPRTADRDKLSKALSRFCREDPTFHVRGDEKTGETLISGMGELHLDIYVERLRREYGIAV